MSPPGRYETARRRARAGRDLMIAAAVVAALVFLLYVGWRIVTGLDDGYGMMAIACILLGTLAAGPLALIGAVLWVAGRAAMERAPDRPGMAVNGNNEEPR
ncbi:hypothetical protein EDC50_2421 [Vulcaniibacterium tengchongense]|uniref:Uncharacterized protein n=2 Tax=Vulcaniibacterium tengchongense TaxID=1273429 RepID=A0A3N4V2H0_9GAMM|nr:hypothetical protein EDC50_2421 [Vulcaniibacterium tengchongense]